MATVVVGRSRTCDLRLPGGDASRRHAEISARGDHFVVRDLGSTNGTFVNGESIQEQRLAPGDRIQIGSNTITFCQVGEALDAPPGEGGEEQTVLVERPALAEVFQGDLSEIPAFAVLQILEMGRKTGLLRIDFDAGVGRLWLVGGEPAHAETDKEGGLEAALVVVNAASGRFSFEPQSAPEHRTLDVSTTELLLEASRRLDEADQ